METKSEIISRIQDINKIDADGRTLLMHAAILGNCEGMQWLLQNGADVNCITHSGGGRTALLYASDFMWEHLNPEVIKILVKGGATIGIKDYCGRTPLLHLNSLCTYIKETIDLLKDKGATEADKNVELSIACNIYQIKDRVEGSKYIEEKGRIIASSLEGSKSLSFLYIQLPKVQETIKFLRENGATD